MGAILTPRIIAEIPKKHAVHILKNVIVIKIIY